jgi:glutathione synthase/RimK-type ligase-like ATP-grasp enzyme
MAYTHTFLMVDDPNTLEENIAKSFDYFTKERQIIVQQFMKGSDFVIKGYCMAGKAFCKIEGNLNHEERQEAKESEFTNFGKFKSDYQDVSQFMEGFEVEELNRFTKMVSEESGLGVVGVDYLYDVDQRKFYVIDINFFSGMRNPEFKESVRKIVEERISVLDSMAN